MLKSIHAPKTYDYPSRFIPTRQGDRTKPSDANASDVHTRFLPTQHAVNRNSSTHVRALNGSSPSDGLSRVAQQHRSSGMTTSTPATDTYAATTNFRTHSRDILKRVHSKSPGQPFPSAVSQHDPLRGQTATENVTQACHGSLGTTVLTTPSEGLNTALKVSAASRSLVHPSLKVPASRSCADVDGVDYPHGETFGVKSLHLSTPITSTLSKNSDTTFHATSSPSKSSAGSAYDLPTSPGASRASSSIRLDIKPELTDTNAIPSVSIPSMSAANQNSHNATHQCDLEDHEVAAMLQHKLTIGDFLRETDDVDEDFDIVGKAELDDDFHIVRGDCPSAVNGSITADVLLDAAEEAFQPTLDEDEDWVDDMGEVQEAACNPVTSSPVKGTMVNVGKSKGDKAVRFDFTE